MTQDELLNLLILRGRRARKKKAEVLVENCFYCGNQKWNLELNVSIGAYKCWACGARGSLTTLLREFYDLKVVFNTTRRRPQVAFKPEADQPVLTELTPGMVVLAERRGLDVGDIARYRIQACVNEKQYDHFLRIFFPLEDYWTRVQVGMLGRSLDGRKPKYLFTGTDRRIVGYRYPRSGVHVVVEGAIDAIMVHKAGFNAAAILGTMSQYVPEWAALVPNDDPILILLDGDAPHEADRLYYQIQPIHPLVYVFHLPSHVDPGMLPPAVISRIVESTVQGAAV